MKSILKAFILTPLVMLFAPQAEGSLTLNINSVDETITFTGSDSGTLGGTLPFTRIQWQIGNESAGTQGLNVGVGFDISNIQPMGASLQGTSFAVSEGEVLLTIIFNSSATSATIAGNGTAISYASLTALNKSYLESLTSADSLTLSTGSGAADIQINAVPEPSTYVLMCVGVAAVALFRRRSAVALPGHRY